MKYTIQTDTINNKDYNIIKLTEGLEDMITSLLQRNSSYLLYGKPGTGKTYNLKKIKERLGKKAIYKFNASDLVSLSTREGINAAISEINKSIEFGRYVVIDDLGAENTIATHFGASYSVIEDLINTVIYPKWESTKDSNKPLKVYITSNLNLSSLLEKYGLRTVDRLTQMCAFVLVDTEDLRESQSTEFIDNPLVKMEEESKQSEVDEVDYLESVLQEFPINTDNIKEESVPVINDETLNDLLNEINDDFED